MLMIGKFIVGRKGLTEIQWCEIPGTGYEVGRAASGVWRAV